MEYELFIFSILSILNACILCFIGYKFLHILQLSDYKLVGYIEWAKDTKAKYLSRLLFLSFLSFSIALVVNACFISYSKYLSLIGIAFYVLLSIIFISNLVNAKKKVPLRSTYRMNRLVTVLFIVCFAASFGFLLLGNVLPTYLYVSILTLSPIFLILLVPLAHYIILPFEELNKIAHINKAKKKLRKYPYLIKIGITGSYGKTSVKYILNSMLSNKYNVCMSPHSYNTPMGLCRVVDKYLEPYHEVLIAEMGANACGDINFLCQMIEPKMGVITGVGNQHLRTFYSINNIKNTKFELVKFVEKQNDGFMVFSDDNAIVSNEFYPKCKCDKVLVKMSENDFLYAKDIEKDISGTKFNLVYQNKEYACSTVLVGEHNVKNILIAAALALKLEVDIKDIVLSIRDLDFVAHRLEVKKVGDYIVLDDSFNSSVQGYQSALDVLSLSTGKKIIVTPGLVELGREEKTANITFGQQIAKVCDVCIVVNEANATQIIEGIKSVEDSGVEIIQAVNLDDAKIKLAKIVEKDAVVLFENDLPDNYI